MRIPVYYGAEPPEDESDGDFLGNPPGDPSEGPSGDGGSEKAEGKPDGSSE